MPSTETPRQVGLGQFLLELRKRKGSTQGEVAGYVNQRITEVNRSHTHVSRWERGRLLIDETELAAVLAFLDATSEETVAALRMHRDASDPNWLLPGIGRALAVMREYEDVATRITNWQPLEIPGPLQTEAYAEVVLRADGGGVAEDLLAFRMARRNWLTSSTIEYEAFIGQQAIEYPSAEGPIAVEMLRELVLLAEQHRHIKIRVMPPVRRIHPCREGRFVLIESDTTTPVVHLEALTSSSTLTNSQDVKVYIGAAEALRRDAMEPAESAKFIAEVADKLESS